MSISDTLKAQKYASVAEIAAAQSKLYADKLEAAPDYAAQAAASASLAATSASQSESASLTSIAAANSATASAISAASSAEAAGEAAADAIQNYIDQSVRVPGSETVNPLPSSVSRANSVFLWSGSSQPSAKLLSEFATLDGTGKIPVSMIPSIALTEPFIVSSQAEMLALNAQIGDIAKRTDLGYSFCLASSPASTLSNWVQLTDDVLAQLGLSSGATMIGATDDSSNPITVQGALALKASIASLALSTGSTLIGATNNSGANSTVQSVLSMKLEKTELAANDGEKFIGICPDIATLRSIEPKSSGQRITVREHTANTGLGGGQFRAVLAGSSYTDNNGTIIKTTGGAAWLRINAAVTNPLMFGAQCRADVSDHVALKAASDASERMDGLGMSYYIEDTVYWNRFEGRRYRKNFTIVAMLTLPTGRPMVRIGNDHYIDSFVIDARAQTVGTGTVGIIWEGGRPGLGGSIRDGYVIGTGSQGIYVSADYTAGKYAARGTIDNIRFESCGQRGTGNGRASFGADGISDFIISNITAHDCVWGIYIRNDLNLPGVDRASNNKLINVRIRGSGRNHATFTDAQGISASFQDNLQIENVTVTDFADNGIDMQYCEASIVNNWRVSKCKDGVFMGDRSCRRHVISNGVATEVDRGIRLLTDGSHTMGNNAPSLSHIKIVNVHVYNPIYAGIYLVNTGKATYGSTMFNVQVSNCSVDATYSYPNSTQTYGFQIQGGVNVTLIGCNTFNIRQHGVYIKDSEFVRILGGTHQDVDRVGSGYQGVFVDTDCSRVSVSDVSVYGSATAGAVTLAGGLGHSVKHVRWRAMANGVTSTAATSPYLFDNTSF